MLCIVTGVAGFIGSSLAQRLLADGHTVRGIDSFVPYYPRALKEKNLSALRDYAGFEFVEGDLNQCDLGALLDSSDWVFHQAAQAGVRASWGSYFESYTNNNILATQRLLEVLRGSKTLKKVVYASSSSIYGNAESFPTSETVRPQPVSPYGVTKLAAEHLMSLYASEFGVASVSLRYFTVYGERQRPDMAFHRFARAALQSEQIVVYGDGEQSRDFTYIGDIVAANIAAAERGAAGAIYNIGGGTQATVNQILTQIEDLVGQKLNIVRQERQSGDARKTSADTTRARNELQFMPSVELAEGLRREVAWMESLLRAD